jgi:hypothetical protein
MDTYSTKNCSRSDLKQLLNFLDSTDVSYTLDDETIIFDITELSSTNQATIKKLLGNPLQENTMNLKENYERLFGKMIVENKLGQRIKQSTPNSLTEKEQLRFSNIQKSFQHQYPNKQLRLREGFVIVDNMIVERMETFFKKNNAQISLTLKQYI